MSEYANFPKDFLERTKENLKNYTGNFEITNLINNCLGLIIIPNELLIDNLSVYEFTDNDKSYGISKKNIHTNISNDYSLKKIVKGIRNGLAHGNIEQRTKNKEISGLKISNIYEDKTKLTVEFTIEEFEEFTMKISNEFYK
jgi:hypothetical protein